MGLKYFSTIFVGSTLLFNLVAACNIRRGDAPQLDLPSIIAANNAVRSKRDLAPSYPKKIALDNVRVFDGFRIHPPSTVIIDGALISTNASGAEHIDGGGGVLLPGLIDTHCHPMDMSNMEDLARHGVTTAFAMACYAPALCASLANHPGLPSLFSATAPASAPNSAHGAITATIDPTLLINNTAEIPAWMDRQLATDYDYIKLVAEEPGFDQNTLNALTKEGHRRGKPIVTHASTLDAYKQATIAGSEHIHHAPLDKPITPSLLRAMRQNVQTITPTLAIMRAIALSEPETRNYTAALLTVRALHQARFPILAGTDANLVPGLVALIPFGSSMHDELENLVEAGMSNAAALRAATSLPSAHFGLRDRGAIKAGMRADLLLVGGNPLEDIKATREVKRVWIGGVEVAHL